MVLRGFCQHPKYQKNKDVLHAAEMLTSRFFQPDVYGSYHSAEYWFRFEFWWTNLLTSLEVLAKLGFTKDNSAINQALGWFLEHQESTGLWKTNYMDGKSYGQSPKMREREEWVTLRIYRVIQHFCKEKPN